MADESLMVIYLAKNKVNGKMYVGQTIHTAASRWKQHCKQAKGSNDIFARAIIKYGADNFDISVLQECQDQEELNAAETKWIETLGTCGIHGYNIRAGGSSGGALSKETKQKLSEVPRTPEWKAKIKEACKARGKEWKDKLKQKALGRKPSKKQLEALAKGWKFAEENPEVRAHYGEENGRALVTESDVRKIRAIYQEGNLSQREIGEMFGLTQMTISDIIRRKTWKNVQG